MNKDTLLIATTNQGKKEELLKVFSSISFLQKVKVLTLDDIKIPLEDVKETGKTFYDNALLKAEYYFTQTKIPTIADDSGLVVPIINGEPGIYSARYSGKDSTSKKNIELLLSKMKDIKERNAYFITSIIFYTGKNSIVGKEGRCYGSIAINPSGSNGFGYDSIFYLQEKQCTVAQLTQQEKVTISHRTKAIRELLPSLEKHFNPQLNEELS